MKKILTAGLVGAALLSSAALTQAVTIYGLTTTNGLVRFDSTTPAIVTQIATITAASGSPAVGSLADLDFYPVNGLLYAFNTTGAGYTINLTTGAATLVVTPTTATGTITGTVTDVDFNPTASRIRLFTTGGSNQTYRMVPDVDSTGALATKGNVTVDGSFSDTAAILVGNAYTNNVPNAASTTLYSIDTNTDRLVVHSTPTGQTGTFTTITTVGTNLGIAVGTDVGFDIDPSGIAYLSNGNALSTVNLTLGTASTPVTVGSTGTGTLKSIAVVVPEPATALLAGLGLVGAMARRRRSTV